MSVLNWEWLYELHRWINTFSALSDSLCTTIWLLFQEEFDILFRYVFGVFYTKIKNNEAWQKHERIISASVFKFDLLLWMDLGETD